MNIMQQTNGTSPVEDATKGLAVGRIVSVTGSQAIALIFHQPGTPEERKALQPEMGTLLKVDTPISVVLCLVSALSAPAPTDNEDEPELWIAEIELVGELFKNDQGVPTNFRRGVMAYPALGDHIYLCSHEELKKAYAWDNEETICIGKIHQDQRIDAVIKVNDMLGKHFAVLGSTGTGKSCSTALLLRKILEKNPEGHIVLIDPHNEYTKSFGNMSEVISVNDLQLPFWFLTFEEIVEVLLGDRKGKSKEIEILADLIPMAKARYANAKRGGGRLSVRTVDNANFSVDAPIPYRISDIMDLLNEHMGRLDVKNSIGPYKALKARIESVTADARYAFMFGATTVQDQMAAILGRLFRIPVNGRPITIVEMTGLPSDVVNVAVSVIARMAFDFALWSGGKIPITIVCEEAHRYLPANSALGFEPTKRSLAKIAKEGRKYGVSLGVISQRPSELDQTILSQCNTLFVMRMANDLDQKIVLSAISDAASSLLEFLPSLGTGECIIFGDGVTLPVRMRFERLPEEHQPRSSTAKFTESWRETIEDNENFLENVVKRWRAAGTPTANAESNNKIAEALPMEDEPVIPVAQAPIQPAPQPQTPPLQSMEPATLDVPGAQVIAQDDLIPQALPGEIAEPELPVAEPDMAIGAANRGPIAAARDEKQRIRDALRSKSRFFK